MTCPNGCYSFGWLLTLAILVWIAGVCFGWALANRNKDWTDG